MDKVLLANDLLPIYRTTDTGEKVVDARELCGFLNVGSRFNDWIARQIKKYGFVEGEDFHSFLSNTSENGGRPRTDYILKLDMAKELAMVENNDQGRKARRYFIEVEKRYREAAPLVPLADSEVTQKIAEIDKTIKLMQLLRVSVRDGFLDGDNEALYRKQIADRVLRTVEQPKSARAPYERAPYKLEHEPQTDEYGGRWYKSSEIAVIAGVTTNLIGKLASRHNLRTSEYCRFVSLNGNRVSGITQPEYNEMGKDELVRLAAVEIANGYVPRPKRKKARSR
ncbi:antA/AntB antirepressor family protein [Paenibacillus bouchesdurhonensis]|uniref:antA/AntB antirepressor family protein n=1 Tax=Paenibacillus bouchesdurhonensis TaxID=1870990 RepID=UPI000DA63AB5|nr:antA/AntB antirepressor family protein [Paenibacillus bouchesdurhonensis]